jgi:hypothetical protein
MSQLQYDRGRKDVPGWFRTSQADEIQYYYLALRNEAAELAPFFSRIRDLTAKGESTDSVQEELIRVLRVDRDLLLTYSLEAARRWFESNPEEAFRGYSGASNPTYVTVSVRVDRDLFCREGPGRLVGPIFEPVRKTL